VAKLQNQIQEWDAYLIFIANKITRLLIKLLTKVTVFMDSSPIGACV